MSNIWEQLEGAAVSLARSGPMKDRLADAYRNHLAHVNVADIPETLREDFLACHHTLTRERPLPGEDAVRATVRKMSSSEADQLACSVVRLFAAIAREVALEAASAAVTAEADAALLDGAVHNGHAAPARVRNGVAPQLVSLYTQRSPAARSEGSRDSNRA